MTLLPLFEQIASILRLHPDHLVTNTLQLLIIEVIE